MLCPNFFVLSFVFILKQRQIHRNCKDSTQRFPCILHPVSPNSYTLCNLQHNIRTWKLTWVPCVSIVSCHFITCIHMCAHHCQQNTELFNHHKDLPHATSLQSHPLPSPCPPLHLSPLATTNLFLISVILSLRECYVNGIIQCVTF